MATLKTLTRSSTKTKLLVAAGIAASMIAAYGLAASQGGFIKKISDADLKAAQQKVAQQKAYWAKELTLDTALVAKEGETARKEVQRWLGRGLEYSWKSEKYEANDSVEEGICDWINSEPAKSDAIYGCSKGSSASADLGEGIPTVAVSAVTADKSAALSKKIVRYTITFTSSLKSKQANIDIRLKCKGPLGVDSSCPDPKVHAGTFEYALAKSSVIVDYDLVKKTMEVDDKSLKLGTVTVKVPSQICVDAVVMGKTCWPLQNALGEKFAAPLKEFIEKAIKDF